MTNRDAAIEAACRAHAPHWDRMDEDIRAYARDQMHAAIAAYEQVRAKDAEVFAWSFELAHAIYPETKEYTDWGKPQLSYTAPCVPDGSIRNLRPLYTHPSPVADVKALREARTWIKSSKGNAKIYTHPDAFEGRAVVVNQQGISFNGQYFQTLEEAQSAALATLGGGE